MYWGDTPLEKVIAGRILSDETLVAIRQRSLDAGVTLIDTAEGYGGGTSEARIGRLGFSRSGHLVATKFLPTYGRWTSGAFVRSQEASNRRLGVETCALSFIHSPVHLRNPEVWIRGAAEAHRRGLLQALGLSNFNAEQTRRAARVARDEGIPLVASQMMFNLLVHRSSALQEAVQACREAGLTVLGYSVLGQGLLIQGFTEEKLESHRLARRLEVPWSRLEPLRATLRRLSLSHQRTMSQVCLQWAVGHDVVPLVGTRSVEQLEDTLGALSFRLTPEEGRELDDLALSESTFDRAPWKRLVFLAVLSGLVASYRVSALWSRSHRSENSGE